jgi:DNA repair exonuclease SbcCD ATPase subunit
MAEEVTLDFIAKQLERVLDEQSAMREAIEHAIDEQAAMRTELRRMAENQMMTARSLENTRNSIEHLRDDLELMIRTEIGGLFAHLETRLERRIDAIIAKVP